MLPPMSDDQHPPADADPGARRAEADRLLSGGPDDPARSRLHRRYAELGDPSYRR